VTKCEKRLNISKHTWIICFCNCLRCLLFLICVTLKHYLIIFIGLAHPHVFVRVKLSGRVNWRRQGIPLVILRNWALIILPEKSVWLHSLGLFKVDYFLLESSCVFSLPHSRLTSRCCNDFHVCFWLSVLQSFPPICFCGGVDNVRLRFERREPFFWIHIIWSRILLSFGRALSSAAVERFKVSLFLSWFFKVRIGLSGKACIPWGCVIVVLLTLVLLFKNEAGFLKHRC